MKVILLENVDKLGKKYEAKEVTNGFALNFLFPRNMAVVYTDELYKTLQNRLDGQKLSETSDLDALKGADEIIFNFKAKTSEKGVLFKQISKDDIINKIKDKFNIDLKPSNLIIDKPLKTLGNFEVKIKNYTKKIIKIVIENEEKN